MKNRATLNFLYTIAALALSTLGISATAKESGALSPLTLQAQERQALRRLFEGTIDEQEGMGNHLTEQVSFAKFLKLIETRFHSGGTQGEVLRTMDWGPTSPARAWLVDQRFNPLLAVAASTIVSGGSANDAFLAIAKEVGVSAEVAASELNRVSFRDLEGWSLLTNQILGFIFDDRGRASGQAAARAYSLDQAGQPLKFDIGLENLKQHITALRKSIQKVAKSSDPKISQRLAGHFISYTPRFEATMDMLDSFELSTLDLQGLLDSIRYKMTLSQVDTAHEALGLKKILDLAVEHREQLINSFSSVEAEIASRIPSGRVAVFNFGQAYSSQSEKLRRQIKNVCSRSIAQMDVVLGFDGDKDLSIRYKTPWELSFLSDSASASGAGLDSEWDSIRTFEIIVEERHYTERWTEQIYHPEVRDAEGKVTSAAYTETVTRTSGHDETDHETVETPTAEIRFQSKIGELNAKLSAFRSQKGAANQIAMLAKEIETIKAEYLAYRQEPPLGKDESNQKIKRLSNQLGQIAALETQVKVAGMRNQSTSAIFNRALDLDTAARKEISSLLSQLDRRRHRTAIAIGGLAATASAAYTCWNLLMPNGWLPGGL